MGDDIYLKVPVGTVVTDLNSENIVADLKTHLQTHLIAKGGKGGLGNAYFKSSTNRAPTIAEKGEIGEKKVLKLELKLVADLGIIGFPSVGKSTLISVISNSKPKIAEYPFTTIIPNLGVVDMRKFERNYDFSFVVTDIPGIIEGAHMGKGLGHQFLKHISRNNILLHLLDPTRGNLKADYEIVNYELKKFDKNLANKEQIIAINKIDAIGKEALEKEIKNLIKKYPELQNNIHQISSATGQNLRELMLHVAEKIKQNKVVDYSNNVKEEDNSIEIVRPSLKSQSIVKFVRKKTLSNGKTKRIWDIKGERIEQIVNMTDIESFEGIQRINHYLSRLGIKKQLQRMGAHSGDTLRVANKKITFKE
ncbi:GTPase ObgE [Candidatus Peregrinibacteria bacterium]|nr:GTPase ObgE [Candidatus Peregrinibacteria bacterium]